MKKIKVAHIINGIGLGGVTNIVYNFLKFLPKDKYDLFLCTLRQPSDQTPGRELRAKLFRDLGVHITCFDQDKNKFKVVGALSQWLIDNSIDILHTHSYKPNLYGRLAGVLCKPRGLKIVSHYQNGYDDKWNKDQSLIYDQLFHPFTERCIACSDWVRDHVANRVGIPAKSITVIPNGVDEVFFSSQPDSVEVKNELNIPLRKKVVGIVGRISEQKGQDDFLHAAKIIQASHPDTVFLIVGSGKDEKIENLRQLTRKLNIEHSVFFLGHYCDMPKLYSVLDVLVISSRWEGFVLTLTEAMACGKPVVATNVGGAPNVIVSGENGFLVPPNAPKEIASNVTQLLTHPELARTFGDRGREKARLYSWKNLVKQVDQVYRSMEVNC
jgi:glycosyltransferase involved in cell wall biosynthesis